MKHLIILSLLCVICLPGAWCTVPAVPRDTSFTTYSTARKIHKKHPEAVLALPTLPPDVREYRDVVYTTLPRTPYGRRELHADVFRPDDNERYPALIMIHGGGWNSGDKSLQGPMAWMIAARGYVTIPVEYRLIPEALYPAGLHDVKTAVRWARANADTYGIDPDHIAISGCSAGAQLATLAGVTNGSRRHEGKGQWGKTPSDVQAIINMDGIATFVSESNIAEARDRYESKGELPVNARWLGGLYEDPARSRHRYASSAAGCPATATVATAWWKYTIRWASTPSATVYRSMYIPSGSSILGSTPPWTVRQLSSTACSNLKKPRYLGAM